ncbi:MAG: cadherin domain-containing protein, partial [Lentilitoribacter sp.]
MSKVEQGSGKASPAKKNKVDTDNLDLGGETPIERMDIVLPGQDEVGAGAGHINQQPLQGGVDAQASPQSHIDAPAEQNSLSTTAGDLTTPDTKTPASNNSANQSRNAQIQDAPSLDGVDAGQLASGAPLAPELNSLNQESRATETDTQQGQSSKSQTTIGSEESGEINAAPVDIDFSNSAVAENASGGTVIATLSTVDADDTDTHTYEIVSDPSGYFEIVGDEIRVKDGANLDFETAPIHEISIQVTDSAGNTFTETMTIDLTDVNEHDVLSISDTDISANTIAENASAGDSVGITASATDADGTNNTVTYSLSDDAGGIFEIDANTGEVSIADASGIDYENATSHTIEVTATSADGSISTQSYTVDVSDIDEHDVGAISDTDGSANTIAEDVSNGDSVGITASATDADGSNNTVTYSLSDDAGGIFEIDANTGEVSIADASGIDYENATSHTIEVTATSADGSTSTQSYTINVTDVDEFDVGAVTDTDSAANTIAENASAGDEVGVTASASDADGTNNTVTYAVDDARFEVASDGTVTVATGASFDAETEGSIDIEVTATSADGSTSTETFSINVSDIDEFDIGAVSDSNASSNAVDEDASVGDTVGITALASDGDVTDDVTYSLSDDAGGLFDIDASTGVVTVAGSLDAETSTSHAIEVTATSDDGSTSTQTFAIGVNDVNETSITAISDTDSSGNTVTEGASVGTAVGITALASDADATDTVSYSLSTNPGGFFAIDANTGEVTVAASLDYETDTSHTIEVTATSTDGTTSTQTFTIAVGDEDEHDVGAISDTDASANTIAEDVSNGDSVGITASATDADGSNNTVTYSLSDDADGIFEIDANTGEVSIADASGIDYENATSHTIEVTATSADGSTSTQSYTIDVTDVAEDIQLADGGVTFTDESVSETSITGGDGSDTITGGDGGIVLQGGKGSDNITGGDGDDEIHLASSGRNDYASNEVADGGDGNDTIYGTNGSSIINGGAGDDYITGGDDWITSDVDVLYGGEGNDTIVSGMDDTVKEGFETGDQLYGEDGDDKLTGGNANDTLVGGADDDKIDGGAGTDTAVYTGNWSDYTITESGGTYTIVDNRAGSPDGTDTVTNVENFEFADGTVEVSDLLDVGPSDIDVTSISVDENSASGTVVATLSATDNALDSHTYTITNDPSGFFEISGDQVLVKAGATLDTENAPSHDITVEVTDGNGNTYSETITINVADIDEFDVGSISDTDGSANTIAEDVSNGDSVGITASATDADGSNNTVTYSLSDDAGGIFEIDAATGEVSIADASGIDYENATSHTIEVTATSADGSTSTQSYTIDVTDVDEFDVGAVSDTDSTANTIAENASAGDEVGVTASATDADGTNNTVTYAVDDARFEVASDGTVTVASGASFDAETEGSIDIEVTATSADGSTSTETFSINVSDIDEFDIGAVSDNNASSNDVDEDASVGDTVGITALASDGDVTDGVSYSLSDDAGGLFDIDASTGVVTVAGSLDAETSTSHTIEVTATSDDGSTSTQTFSIGVNDVNETSITAISDSDASGNTVTEGASVGTAVGITALASDADATDTVSYSLSSNPGGFFAIDANTGEVTVAGSLDYETDTSHTIEVTATSTDGTTSTQTFTIAVGDENENVQLADGGVTFTDTGVTETSVIGGTGDDTITGTSGDDVIGGNAGDDVVNAGDGNDKFDDSASGNGDDTVNMGAGDDYAYGGDGSDVIDGGTGEDFIHGEDGNDTLTGGADDDTIRGGDGVDIAVFSGDRADYTISHSESPYYDGGVWTVTGPDGTDKVMEIETFRFDDGDYSAADLQETADQTIVGTVNDDVLNGGSGNDTISGLSGDDVVNAGAGDDRFDDTSTGNGNDTLNMGEGNDTAYGGDGTDTINGDEGDDKLYGESGNDTITGGEGNDAIDGGTGDDTAVFSGNWADYTITESGGTYTVVDNRPGSPDGTDTVRNVEFFEFADGTTTADDVIDVGPSDIDLSATSIDENSSAGTVVATLSAEDNSLDVQSYTITNDPSGFFEISGDQVVVKAGADIDFENATSHDITIEVSDGAGSTYTETITIDVSDIDEFNVGAVTDTDSAANTIAENASAGDEVGVTASASDADGTNNTVTYAVDDARFEVASDGTVTVASGASFDAETEGSIDIEVTATSADGSTSTETFSINVSDIDEFDVGAVSDSNASSNAVDEDASIGDTVGITATASDGDITDGVTYSLSDDAGGIFEIDANTGEVSIADASGIDYENATSHTIEVTATSADGSTSTQSYTINVTDVDEFDVGAVTDTDSAANTIAENASTGDEVGVTASASDADGTNNTVTYAVDDARFEVASDGTVTVASGASFDAETEGSIDIEVTATS